MAYQVNHLFYRLHFFTNNAHVTRILLPSPNMISSMTTTEPTKSTVRLTIKLHNPRTGQKHRTTVTDEIPKRGVDHERSLKRSPKSNGMPKPIQMKQSNVGVM